MNEKELSWSHRIKISCEPYSKALQCLDEWVQNYDLTILRGVDLDFRGFKGLCESLGPLGGREGIADIVRMTNKSRYWRSDTLLPWHQDLSFLPHPPSHGALYCKTSTSQSGTTDWCSLMMPPQKLTPATSSLTLIHRFNSESTSKLISDKVKYRGRSTRHPLIISTNKKEYSLFFNPLYCNRESISSQNILSLVDQLYSPFNIYRHRWACGDLILYNNFYLAHRRQASLGGSREMWRGQIYRSQL